jgi:hypothetical protein
LIDLSHHLHGAKLRRLGQLVNPPAAWDSMALGWVGPIKDQGQCGSCWDFSGTRTCEVAFNKAGVGGGPSVLILSEEYTLSCGSNGGCNGDDNVNVLDWAKKTGLPLTADYGPYSASPGQCAWKSGMALYKIDDWAFCDKNGGQGVTPPEDIKAGIMLAGGVGCAVDAGFSDPGTGVIDGNGNNIDHDVFLSGWEDTATKVTATVDSSLPSSVIASDGVYIMDNSWGTRWGNKGRARIRWKAYSVGTEAVIVIVRGPAPAPLDWNSL